MADTITLNTSDDLLTWAKKQTENDYDAKRKYKLHQDWNGDAGMLEATGSSKWFGTRVRLSAGLFTQLASCWKKDVPRWGSPTFRGIRTPLSIAELVFGVDKMKQVRTEATKNNKERKRVEEIRSRNWKRKGLRDAAAKLIKENGDTYADMTLRQLTQLEDESE